MTVGGLVGSATTTVPPPQDRRQRPTRSATDWFPHRPPTIVLRAPGTSSAFATTYSARAERSVWCLKTPPAPPIQNGPANEPKLGGRPAHRCAGGAAANSARSGRPAPRASRRRPSAEPGARPRTLHALRTNRRFAGRGSSDRSVGPESPLAQRPARGQHAERKAGRRPRGGPFLKGGGGRFARRHDARRVHEHAHAAPLCATED
jgi:hypothetical protein